MKRTLNVHLPARVSRELSHSIAHIFAGTAHVSTSSAGVLALESLKCFSIHYKGSLMHSRAPFVYPLMDEAYHKYYLTDRGVYPYLAPGADWVFLGGNAMDFCAKLFEHVRKNNVQAVALHPFTAVGGELSDKARPGEARLRLVKKSCFHNDIHVQKHKEMLLSRPPEEWESKSYPLVKDRYDSIVEHVRKYLKIIAPRTVIELGCGLGNTTSRLAREFPSARVIGYDFSPHSIEVCRKSYNQPNLEFQLGDFTTPLPHENGSVDLVISIEATNMSQSPVFTAGECCRVLSDNGLLVNCSLSESSYIYWDFPASLFLPVHMNTFATDWYSVARQAGCGFQIVPWNLASFTFIACRTPEFMKEHHAFQASRMADPVFRLSHDRFAMLIGKNVPLVKPVEEHDHLSLRSYPAYVRRCLAEADTQSAEFMRFTRWSAELVDAELKLLPEAREFIACVLAEHKEERLAVA